MAVQIGFLVWGYARTGGDRSANSDKLITPLIGSLVFAGVTIGLTLSSNDERQDAILTYNQGFDGGSSLHLGPTRNGFGFVYGF